MARNRDPASTRTDGYSWPVKRCTRSTLVTPSARLTALRSACAIRLRIVYAGGSNCSAISGIGRQAPASSTSLLPKRHRGREKPRRLRTVVGGSPRGVRPARSGTDTAVTYAALRVTLERLGRPIPANDEWITALAPRHRLPVLSRDLHFDVVPDLERQAW